LGLFFSLFFEGAPVPWHNGIWHSGQSKSGNVLLLYSWQCADAILSLYLVTGEHEVYMYYADLVKST